MPLIPHVTIENHGVQALRKPEPDSNDRALVAGAVTAIARMRNCPQSEAERILHQLATES